MMKPTSAMIEASNNVNMHTTKLFFPVDRMLRIEGPTIDSKVPIESVYLFLFCDAIMTTFAQ